jgi:competence protein ComEC
MFRIVIVIIFILVFPSFLRPNFLPFLVVWNVGQGQWVTHISPKSCIHIDMGGEYFPKVVLDWCKHKNNYVQISHWDWDHYSFLRRYEKQIPLDAALPKDLHLLYSTQKFKDKNSNSNIHILNTILLTGDATKKSERQWAHLVPSTVRVVLAPHHGSNTSSSEYLLSHLPSIKMAIASARKQRYGHPHHKVSARYQRFKIPLLRTEVWGHIAIQL